MVAAEADGLSGTTLRNCHETFRRCETIAQIKVTKLNQDHLTRLTTLLLNEGWRGGNCAMSRRSVKNTLALVSMLLYWGVERGLIMRNVAANKSRRGRNRISQPEKTPTRHYERTEAERLIREATKTRHAQMIIFCFETGLRRGELLVFDGEDIKSRKTSGNDSPLRCIRSGSQALVQKREDGGLVA